MSYTNADGVYVLTSVDQGAIQPNGTTTNIFRRSLVIDVDFTQIGATFTSANINPQAATIPANATLVGATLIMSVAATSAGAATLDIGTYLASGTAVVATGILAAAAITTHDAIGEVVRAGGTQVAGTATIGTAAVYVGLKYNTAAYTAGVGKLVIDYIVV